MQRLTRRLASRVPSLLAGAFMLAVLLTAAVGCKTLPEAGVKSFADATNTLTSTIAAAGRAAVDDVAGSDIEKAKELSDELKAAWESRIKAMQAMRQYADALTSLVEAGKAGEANAKAFADSLMGLARAVKDIPGSAAGDAIVQGVSRIYGEIAKQLSAREIQKAVGKADPLVAQAAALLSQDLVSLRNLSSDLHRRAVGGLNTRHSVRPFLRDLKKARDASAAAALGTDAQAAAAALERTRKLDDLATAYAASPAYLEYREQEQALERGHRAQSELLDQASLTIGAWAASHHELVVGLRENRPPSLQELSRLANDLYEIYKEYRTARSKK